MGSEGDDDESVDSEEGSGDAMAEEGDADADADMDADSSGAEEMEDLAGDEARAGRAAMATGLAETTAAPTPAAAAVGAGAPGLPGGVLSAASDQRQNIQPVVLPSSGAAVAPAAGGGGAVLREVNCGVASGVPAAPPAVV